jgi:hypothetical protein
MQIRPSAEALRKLPTLKTETPEDWPALRERAESKGVRPILELKLETADTRYWLCTQGFAEKPEGGPYNWIVGYVTIDYKNESGDWASDGTCYGPDSTKFLQGNDYLRGLVAKKETLQAKQEREHSWETAKEISAIQAEIDQILRAAGIPQWPRESD